MRGVLAGVAGIFMCSGKCKRKLIIHIFLILTFEVPIDYLCKNLWRWFCHYCNSISPGMAIVNGLKVLTTTSLCSIAWILLTGICLSWNQLPVYADW